MDKKAAILIAELARLPWNSTHFLTYSGSAEPAADGRPADGAPPSASGGQLADILLTTPDGAEVRMSDELADADFVMMIASADGAATAAAAIGDSCTLRGIMTAGMIFGEESEMKSAIAALRPNARVLLISKDQHDAAEILSTIGG